MIQVILFTLLIQLTTSKVWTPFNKKSSCKEDFCYESTMRIKGEVVGFADYDDDRIVEMILLDETKRSLKLCEQNEETYEMTETGNIYTFNETIINIIPGDILFRGQTDLFVQTQKEGETKYNSFVCYHNDNQLNCTILKHELYAEINAFDINGDNYIDIISQDKDGKTIVLLNQEGRTFEQTTKYQFPNYDKNFPVTFVDINGDCRADIVFVAKNNQGNHNISICITTKQEKEGDYERLNYTLHSSIDTEMKLTSIMVSDFTRNGNIDIIVSTTTNQIFVLKNEQKELCKSFVKSYDWCRAETNMCVADNAFIFNMSNAYNYTFTDNLTMVLENGMAIINQGDYNIDAYSDLMILIEEKASKQRYMILLKNNQGKEFVIEQSEYELIKKISTNAISGTFFDIGNDGMLNLFFNIYNKETNERYVECISNNLKPDALFVKIDGLNGVCVSGCDEGYEKISPKPYGSMYFGGIFKLALTNAEGNNVGMISVQMSQTTHHTIQLPYAHIGLGRISNYIQVCEFGTNMNVTTNHQQFLSIIPNSQLVVIPHPPLKAASWVLELYFLDLNLMFWIAIVMTVALIILGIVMVVLYVKDKKAKLQNSCISSRAYEFIRVWSFVFCQRL